MPKILVDSSFLVAVGYARAPQHGRAVEFGKEFWDDFLIPEVVLVEAMYNLKRLGGTQAALQFGHLFYSQSP